MLKADKSKTKLIWDISTVNSIACYIDNMEFDRFSTIILRPEQRHEKELISLITFIRKYAHNDIIVVYNNFFPMYSSPFFQIPNVDWVFEVSEFSMIYNLENLDHYTITLLIKKSNILEFPKILDVLSRNGVKDFSLRLKEYPEPQEIIDSLDMSTLVNMIADFSSDHPNVHINIYSNKDVVIEACMRYINKGKLTTVYVDCDGNIGALPYLPTYSQNIMLGYLYTQAEEYYSLFFLQDAQFLGSEGRITTQISNLDIFKKLSYGSSQYNGYVPVLKTFVSVNDKMEIENLITGAFLKISTLQHFFVSQINNERTIVQIINHAKKVYDDKYSCDEIMSIFLLFLSSLEKKDMLMYRKKVY